LREVISVVWTAFSVCLPLEADETFSWRNPDFLGVRAVMPSNMTSRECTKPSVDRLQALFELLDAATPRQRR
jgi:hypothetical protein